MFQEKNMGMFDRTLKTNNLQKLTKFGDNQCLLLSFANLDKTVAQYEINRLPICNVFMEKGPGVYTIKPLQTRNLQKTDKICRQLASSVVIRKYTGLYK